MRLLLFSALLTAAVCLPMGPAAAACDQFTPFGQPVSSNLLEDVGAAAAPNRIVICHTGQIVAFNPERNVSDWVAYRLRRFAAMRTDGRAGGDGRDFDAIANQVQKNAKVRTSMLSRGRESGPVAGSEKAVCAVNLARPSSTES